MLYLAPAPAQTCCCWPCWRPRPCPAWLLPRPRRPGHCRRHPAARLARPDHSRLLPAKLRGVPEGLSLVHLPGLVRPVPDPAPPGPYAWKHQTAVRAEVANLQGVECGSYIWYDASGWHPNLPETPAAFARLFGCPGTLQAHLRGADFFDVAHFPEASFELGGVAAGQAQGQLTLKGQTRLVRVPVSITPLGPGSLLLTGLAQLDRTQFGINYNSSSFFQNLGSYAIRNDFQLAFSLRAGQR